MRPGRFEDGLVFFGIKVRGGGREGPADVRLDHRHQVAHDGFGKDFLTRGGVDVIDQFEEGLPLRVLPMLFVIVGDHNGIIVFGVKGKDNRAQFEFENKEGFSFGR